MARCVTTTAAADEYDLDLAARHCATGAFTFAGQRCSASSRIPADEAVHDARRFEPTVAAATPTCSEADTVDIANADDLGLDAAVFTADHDRAMRVTEAAVDGSRAVARRDPRRSPPGRAPRIVAHDRRRRTYRFRSVFV
jgi:acyl-CoA reductase-like NAD-dependent aldehyde dehydrogenase